jgi:hypothetical protein
LATSTQNTARASCSSFAIEAFAFLECFSDAHVLDVLRAKHIVAGKFASVDRVSEQVVHVGRRLAADQDAIGVRVKLGERVVERKVSVDFPKRERAIAVGVYRCAYSLLELLVRFIGPGWRSQRRPQSASARRNLCILYSSRSKSVRCPITADKAAMPRSGITGLL